MRQHDVAGERGAGLLALAAIASLIIALAVLPSPAQASPGWDLILDRPKPDFQGIDFPTPGEGWLVAGAGILHSTDGGATWQENARLTANDVDFAGTAHGWIAGPDGAIYATTDGGATWEAQRSGTRVHLQDVVAVGDAEVWVVGNGEGYSDAITLPIPSTLIHTTDGGAAWQHVELPAGAWFHKLEFVGEQGWLLGEQCIIPPDASYCTGEFHSVILHTTDGGATWAPLEAASPRNVLDFDFVDELHGWLIGEVCDDAGCRSSPYRTVDGGATWEPADVSEFGSLIEVQFTDTMTGWAIAHFCAPEGCLLNVLQSSDGGASWISLAEVDLAAFQGVRNFSLQGGRLYLTGVDLALRSETGGLSWQEMENPALELAAVDFVSASDGFAASGHTLMRSNDGGESWERAGPAPGFTRIFDFLDASTGFAATNSCGTACGPTIERTTDGGRTWTTVHSTTQGGLQRGIEFAGPEHGWVVTETGVIVTEDGGVTWQERPLPATTGELILEAGLAGPNDGWALVQGSAPAYLRNLVHSTDGGRTWANVRTIAEPSYPAPIVFVDADHGWYADTVCQDTCRVVVNATADGGQTWNESDLGPAHIYDMAFADAVNGWLNVARCNELTCSPDEIIHSADGGRTWIRQLSGDLLFGSLEFVDVRHGWFLLDPSRGLGLGGGPPQRTKLYRTTDAGGGPIGVVLTPPPKFPDVGTGPASTGSPGLTPIALLLGAGAVALGAGAFVARRRWP